MSSEVLSAKAKKQFETQVADYFRRNRNVRIDSKPSQGWRELLLDNVRELEEFGSPPADGITEIETIVKGRLRFASVSLSGEIDADGIEEPREAIYGILDREGNILGMRYATGRLLGTYGDIQSSFDFIKGVVNRLPY